MTDSGEARARLEARRLFGESTDVFEDLLAAACGLGRPDGIPDADWWTLRREWIEESGARADVSEPLVAVMTDRVLRARCRRQEQARASASVWRRRVEEWGIRGAP